MARPRCQIAARRARLAKPVSPHALRHVRHFSAAWTLALAAKLSDLLYAFTAKCFMGDLKIWPLRQYEEFEALDPELRARMDTGEASFDEFIEALNRVRHGTPANDLK